MTLNLVINWSSLIYKLVVLRTKFNWTPEGAERKVRLLNSSVIEAKIPKFVNQLTEIHGVDNWKTVMKSTANMTYGLRNGKN